MYERSICGNSERRLIGFEDGICRPCEDRQLFGAPPDADEDDPEADE